ncbi:MAG: PHP domain-containing protein [Bacilli bacterium]
MKEKVFNRSKLTDKEIDIEKEKCRAFIVDSNDNIIVCEYDGVYLLPGGSKEENETDIDCLKRELHEELGLDFTSKEIVPFIRTIDYQKDYVTRDGNTKKRKVITNFYVINSNLKINYDNLNLTDEEKGHMKYHKINYHHVYNLLNYPNSNPRKEFFDKELIRVTLEYANSKNIDLHTHTSYSDGEYSKEELIARAKGTNINVLSICDHDVTKAFSESGLEEQDDFLLIPGVEIGCKCDTGLLHVLGYDYDINNSYFNEFLKLIRNNHIENMRLNNEGLKSLFGFKIDDDIVDNLIEEDKVSRVYLAKELVKMNCCDSIKDAFSKYLNDTYNHVRPNLKEVTWQETFENIKAANGLVVLAHPVSLKQSNGELELTVAEMKYWGLDGIETYNQIYSNDDIEFFQHLASKYNLYQTIGSDYHGEEVKPNVKLGNGSAMSTKVKKLNFVEEIKKRHNIK